MKSLHINLCFAHRVRLLDILGVAKCKAVQQNALLEIITSCVLASQCTGHTDGSLPYCGRHFPPVVILNVLQAQTLSFREAEVAILVMFI